MVVKDFTVIHSMPAEERAQVLAILRDIYDGYSSRKFGNGLQKDYRSKFNILAGMTDAIEKDWSLNTLGERFLMYRITIKDRREHARRALRGMLGRPAAGGAVDPRTTEEWREDLQLQVRDFLKELDYTVPYVSEEVEERIYDLAEILSTCRTHVHRDRNDDIPYVPQAELLPRISKQLARLGMSLAMVRGRPAVGPAELRVMKRVVLDSLPTNRRLLLGSLYKADRREGYRTDSCPELLKRVSTRTVTRELENLVNLGALETWTGKTDAGSDVKLHGLTETFAGYCDAVGGV
jgi:hypothetical protein